MFLTFQISPSFNNSLHKTCENTGFLPYKDGEIRVKENPYCCIFYAVIILNYTRIF